MVCLKTKTHADNIRRAYIHQENQQASGIARCFFWTNGLKLKKKLNFFLWLAAAKLWNHFPIKVMDALFLESFKSGQRKALNNIQQKIILH